MSQKSSGLQFLSFDQEFVCSYIEVSTSMRRCKVARTSKRGRPRGSKTNDYQKQLRTVAAVLVRNPGSSNRKAFLKAIELHGRVGHSDDANLKALQRKWKVNDEREKYLDEARERQKEKSGVPQLHVSDIGSDGYLATARLAALADAFRTPLQDATSKFAHFEALQGIDRITQLHSRMQRAADQIQRLHCPDSPLANTLRILEREQAMIKNMGLSGIRE